MNAANYAGERSLRLTLAQRHFHLICYRHPAPPGAGSEFDLGAITEEQRAFFARFGGMVDFKGKRVLDVGCGYGPTCLYMAQHGARAVVGIDIDPVRIGVAQAKLAADHPDLAGRLQIRHTQRITDLGQQQFDLILSKDSFEHIARPEEFIADIPQHLVPGGLLAIGFSPLWKSPTGGHIAYMTRFPWAHLLFPEEVIVRERERFRPDDQVARLEDIVGGLNKMTLAKFERVLAGSGLECVTLRANVGNNPLLRAFSLLRRLPGCREYFTVNLYSVWRRPA